MYFLPICYNFKNLNIATFIVFAPSAIQIDMYMFYTNTYLKFSWGTALLAGRSRVILIFFLVWQPDNDHIWLKHVADLN